MHHPMHRPVHGAACLSGNIQIPQHQTYTERDYTILLLPIYQSNITITSIIVVTLQGVPSLLALLLSTCSVFGC